MSLTVPADYIGQTVLFGAEDRQPAPARAAAVQLSLFDTLEGAPDGI